jgi:hypothetical protein
MAHLSSTSIDRLIRSLVACALVIGVNYIPVAAPSVLPERSQPPVQANSVQPTFFKSAASVSSMTTFDSPIATPDASTSSSTLTTEPNSSTALTTTITYAPPLTVTQVMVNQSGGHLASADNRIQLDVPAGVFANQTQVSITPRLVNTAVDPYGTVIRFDLDA